MEKATGAIQQILTLARLKKQLIRNNTNGPKYKDPIYDGHCCFKGCKCTMFENAAMEEDSESSRYLVRKKDHNKLTGDEKKLINDDAKKFVTCKNCGHGNIWHVKTTGDVQPRYRNVLQREFSTQYSLRNMVIPNLDDGDDEDDDDLGHAMPESPLRAIRNKDNKKGKNSIGKRSMLDTVKAARALESAKVDYRARLIDFYEKNNPSKMKDVDATLDKYKGREKELFRRLKLKYQAPDNILVESEF